ncbi:sodium-dependent tyrosine transporter [Sulfurovum sp. ST-21]|uniref:Sodium-dependent tyrosine transporter n=1 Tax=Sulfurovum indicum TaxID=2779528 RepID=A0A7M1S200_9BACT|nr:sodium-dependent tyrosine transporter [Sulfurovum indicum]QOR61254.1 sodium-dependent tyrosine transporter [Sulfurovum indicum]
MFVKLNNRVFLNTDKITRVKVAEIKDEIRIHFYEGTTIVAKSQKFKTAKAAIKWIEDNMK